jgi:hypothetical protein
MAGNCLAVKRFHQRVILAQGAWAKMPNPRGWKLWALRRACDTFGTMVDAGGAMRSWLANTPHLGFGLSLVVLGGIVLLSCQNVRCAAEVEPELSLM